MDQAKVKKMVLSSLFTAGICASTFSVCLLMFFFVSIAMVMGSGKAPKISHVAFAILDFTKKLLGLSSNGAAFKIVLFWGFIVFAFLFVFILLLKIVISNAKSTYPTQK
jgi:hypothetical protein